MLSNLVNRLSIILIIVSFSAIAQDSTVTWIKNIDTLNYKTSFNKKDIPKSFYKHLSIDKLKEVANPGQDWSSGCVRQKNVPHMALNWVAHDDKDHYMVSMSYGGYAHRTLYYCFDKGNKKINVNEISFSHRFTADYMTFGETVRKIRQREFKFNKHVEPEEE